MNPFFMLILGGVVGYGVGSVSQKAKNEKKALPSAPVLALGPACSTWEVLDYPTLSLLVRKIYIDERLAGVTDPYVITDKVVATLASKCRPAQGIRNLNELNLYSSFWDSIFGLLVNDEALPPDLVGHLHEQFETWHETMAGNLGG